MIGEGGLTVKVFCVVVTGEWINKTCCKRTVVSLRDLQGHSEF